MTDMMIKMGISRLGDVFDEEVGWDAPQANSLEELLPHCTQLWR
jgi:hypothetical protein